MPVTIQNNTSRPVMIRLNSGQTCYLNGGDSLGKIHDAEVRDNDKLSRLATRGTIICKSINTKAMPAAKTKVKKTRHRKTK